MSSLSNQRGEYGVRSLPPPSAIARTGEVPIETKRTVVNHVIIGLGVVIGAVGWPMYTKNKPLGVIALGVSGSMVSSGILGLLLGRTGGHS